MDTILYFRLTPKISIQTQVSSRPCGPLLSPQLLQLMPYLLSTDFAPGPLWMLTSSTDIPHHMTLQRLEFSDHPDDEGDKWSVGHHLRSVVIFKSRLKCKTQIYGLLNEA